MNSILVFLFILFFPVSLQENCTREILIEHIGSSDKPIYPLLISTKEVQFTKQSYEGQIVAVLSDAEFAMIEKSLLSFASSIPRSKLNAPDFSPGTFSMMVADSCGKSKVVLYNKKNSKLFLNFLLKRTKLLNSKAKMKMQPYLVHALEVF